MSIQEYNYLLRWLEIISEELESLINNIRGVRCAKLECLINDLQEIMNIVNSFRKRIQEFYVVGYLEDETNIKNPYDIQTMEE